MEAKRRMAHWDSLRSIVEHASLKIVEFDVHKRTSLNYVNRILPCYVVSYIKEGTCRVRFEGKDYYAGPGDVVFLPPHIAHDHIKDTDETTVFMWWHFHFQIADVMDVFSLFHLPVCFPLPNAERLEAIFNQYMIYATQPRNLADIIMKESKALELIAVLLEAVLACSEIRLTAKVTDLFANILSDMVRHPEQHYTLKDLERKYHLHPTYITNQFKRIFRITPKQLQTKVRLEQAKKLLITDQKSISEIAFALGYQDLDDFSRFFKMNAGMSPLQYRKSNNGFLLQEQR